ncbi:hypothetical protein Q1B72_000189 [Salmonella enterica]|nr:hypothetical protein [Salmonella enterica]
MSNIDKQAFREELSNPAIGSKDHLRKLALSLLDELDVKEEQRANWFQMAQKLGEDLDAAERHIAETDHDNAELTTRIELMDRRIAELEAKLANPVLLPKTNGYWNEQEKAYEEAITLAKRQIRLAGFSTEDM